MLSLSGHKFYGPKGVGALYLRKRVRVTPLMHGGEPGAAPPRRHAQRARASSAWPRRSTSRMQRMDEEAARERAMRDRLWSGLRERIPDIWLNGHPTQRLPNTLNFRVEGIEGEAMILCLDMNLIGVSSGSACTTGSLEPSHVLLAMGIPAEIAHGSLRVSLGRGQHREGHRLLPRRRSPTSWQRLRMMSPVYNK